MFPTFEVCGTIRFGMTILDRGAIFVDIKDAQEALDMIDGSTEILGYFKIGEVWIKICNLHFHSNAKLFSS